MASWAQTCTVFIYNNCIYKTLVSPPLSLADMVLSPTPWLAGLRNALYLSIISVCVKHWYLPSANLKELISQTMASWAQECSIQDPELVRVMFSLLRRQYDGIGALLRAMRKSMYCP